MHSFLFVTMYYICILKYLDLFYNVKPIIYQFEASTNHVDTTFLVN